MKKFCLHKKLDKKVSLEKIGLVDCITFGFSGYWKILENSGKCKKFCVILDNLMKLKKLKKYNR